MHLRAVRGGGHMFYHQVTFIAPSCTLKYFKEVPRRAEETFLGSRGSKGSRSPRVDQNSLGLA